MFQVADVAIWVGVDDSCACQRWSATLPGPGWGELREHGVDFGSGGHRHALTETTERTTAVGGITYPVDIAVGEMLSDHVEQPASQIRFRRAAFDRQRGQDR